MLHFPLFSWFRLYDGSDPAPFTCPVTHSTCRLRAAHMPASDLPRLFQMLPSSAGFRPNCCLTFARVWPMRAKIEMNSIKLGHFGPLWQRMGRCFAKSVQIVSNIGSTAELS